MKHCNKLTFGILRFKHLFLTEEKYISIWKMNLIIIWKHYPSWEKIASLFTLMFIFHSELPKEKYKESPFPC